MFDLSWSEILVIGVAALIFIGPKELPNALRTLGQWTGRARTLAREFQRNIDEMVHESEIAKLKQQAEEAAKFDFGKAVETAVDPKGDLKKSLDGADFHPPASDTPPPEPAPQTPAAPPGQAATEPQATAAAPSDPKPTASQT